MSPTLITVLVIVAVLVIALIVMFNSFIGKRNRVDEAWADIDVQLKRRYDLIPNLVNAVKGYAKHESSVFENVSEARARAMGAQGTAEQAEAENMLTGALKSILAVSEAYPELKANQNFMELQRELSDTENKIQAARRFYNTNVRDFNTSIQTFPGNVIASMFKFGKRDFFELAESEAAAREAVEVKF